MHRTLHEVADRTVRLGPPEECRDRPEPTKRVVSIDRVDPRGRRRRVASAAIPRRPRRCLRPLTSLCQVGLEIAFALFLLAVSARFLVSLIG